MRPEGRLQMTYAKDRSRGGRFVARPLTPSDLRLRRDAALEELRRLAR